MSIQTCHPINRYAVFVEFYVDALDADQSLVSYFWSNNFTVNTTLLSTQVARSGEVERKVRGGGKYKEGAGEKRVLDQGAEKHVRDKHVRGNGATEFENVPGDGTTFANHVGAKDVQNLKQIDKGAGQRAKFKNAPGDGADDEKLAVEEYAQGKENTEAKCVADCVDEFNGENGSLKVNHSGGGGQVESVDPCQLTAEPVAVRMASMAPPKPQDKPPPEPKAMHDLMGPPYCPYSLFLSSQAGPS